MCVCVCVCVCVHACVRVRVRVSHSLHVYTFIVCGHIMLQLAPSASNAITYIQQLTDCACMRLCGKEL